MMSSEAYAQFSVVKDGKAILVMEEGTPDYVTFENIAPDDAIDYDSHVTLEELKAMTTVTVNKTSDGKNGNVITCNTTAPVSAKWTIDGRDYAYKNVSVKKKVGEYTVHLSALCPDGTKLESDFVVTCDEITDDLEKAYIYGEDPEKEPAFAVTATGSSADLRFSDNEGKHWPYISDEVYFGHKTLIFDIVDCKPGDAGIWGETAGPAMFRVMNGWWSAVYADDVEITEPGLWELPMTEEMAQDCARGAGGRDLNLLLKRGSVTFGAVYYLEGDGKVVKDVQPEEEKPVGGVVGEPVDLGLSVKWSNVNIGASKPQNFGNYYAWGETKIKDDYSWSTYKYSSGSSWQDVNKYTADDGQKGGIWYNSKTGEFIGDGKTSLERSDDAASVNMGGSWSMPTAEDWEELLSNCTWEWTNDYDGTGESGFVITSKADANTNSIFLPAAGYINLWNDGRVGNDGYSCIYWSSSHVGEASDYMSDSYGETHYAVGVWCSDYSLNVSFQGCMAHMLRGYGMAVRAVCPFGGATSGFDAVDLGLPSGKLWAAQNVGASAPEENGSYYAWGETETKTYYDWSTYKYTQGDVTDKYDGYGGITKYQIKSVNGRGGSWYDENHEFVGDGKTSLESGDDVAVVAWGEEWRMPTLAEYQELYDNTTHEWTDDYFGTGVSGYILTSTKEGFENAYIFLPAAGYRDGAKLQEGDCMYWSSSLTKYSSQLGYSNWNYTYSRCYGLPVRPVCPAKTK